MTPYQPLEVVDTYSRADGHRYFVRDEEESHLFNLVEYLDRRLQCWCDDGHAHAESPDTEAPCRHLRSVVDLRMATLRSSRPVAPIAVSAWVD